MQFVDTHCHIHEMLASGDEVVHGIWRKADTTDPDAIIARAQKAGVKRLICVGTSAADSRLAVDFVQNRQNCWASIGIHPHEAKDGQPAFDALAALLASTYARDSEAAGRVLPDTKSGSSVVQPELPTAALRETHTFLTGRTETGGVAMDLKIVAIGECGLDYYYNHSSKQHQQKALRFQIELALAHNLPLIFHVREAFDDFWPIFDSYQGIRGVLHSFTDTRTNMEKALERGLYIGANGIMTFTKDQAQLDTIKAVPLQKLLIETDAPFLTPVPFRGKVNEPAHGSLVAIFLAQLRGEALEALAAQTTANALTLFTLK